MARRRPQRGGGGQRAPRASAAPGGRSPHAWYHHPDPAREVTPNGTAQLRAARAGELALGPDVNESLREIGAMRGIGVRASAGRVMGAVRRLDVELQYHGSLRGVAKAAAGDHPIKDPGRPGRIVRAQLDLVVGAGPGAIAAARQVAALTRAFSAVLEEHANAADEYRRDGAAAELYSVAAARKVARQAYESVDVRIWNRYSVAAERKFARQVSEKHKFAGMTVDLDLETHSDNEVEMRIGRRAIMSPVRPVEYHVFRARLPEDEEEIDSPKAARNAYECEVRVPGGALVNPGGIRAAWRAHKMNPEARQYLARLRGLGAGVQIGEGL